MKHYFNPLQPGVAFLYPLKYSYSYFIVIFMFIVIFITLYSYFSDLLDSFEGDIFPEATTGGVL